MAQCLVFLFLIATIGPIQKAAGQSQDEEVCLYDMPPYEPPCSCGGAGQWTRIAHLDMSDPSQQCPSGWSLTTTPVRGCIRPSSTNNCHSATFQTKYNGQTYSRVCGRIYAYQRGSPDAFGRSIEGNPGLEDAYIDGVSLTHGAPGSRQHIWSFVGSVYETATSYNAKSNCACTNSDQDWPYQVPSFVGNNYFCDTGNPGPDFPDTVHTDDPLWDGAGCGPTNTCCQFNNPPWFCTTLSAATTDALELRICHDEAENNEDIIVSFVELAVM